MKNRKMPGPDGISVKIHKKFWHIIDDNFTIILNKFVNCCQEME